MRIGTRGSALARAQAGWVAARLTGSTGSTGRAELVEITTAGDRGERVSDKSRWVSELERALLDGRIDVAVHSAKDVPAELAKGLELVAISEREDPRDAICGAPSVEALPPGARVGTSSLRRAGQLRALREDIQIVAVYGNVDTRLRKLADGDLDALVLAFAGLRRLGRDDAAGALLDALVPAAGQGALALEARAGELDPGVIGAVNDPDALACVTVERELTAALGASCNTAVGAHARSVASDTLELTGWVGLPDGSRWIHDQLRGPPGDGLGRRVAERMLAVGAAELLVAAESESGG